MTTSIVGPITKHRSALFLIGMLFLTFSGVTFIFALVGVAYLGWYPLGYDPTTVVQNSTTTLTLPPTTKTVTVTNSTTLKTSLLVTVTSPVTTTLSGQSVTAPVTNTITSTTTSSATSATTLFTSTPSIKTVTAFGASIDTTQSKFGGASGRFVASSNQYVLVSNSPDWAFGTNPFTVDFWFRANTLPLTGGVAKLFQNADATFTNYYEFYIINNGGGIYTYYFGGSGQTTQSWLSSPNLAALTWYHMALVRDSNYNLYLFQGGANLGTKTNYSANLIAQNAFYIGGDSRGIQYSDIWVDEFRVSSVARWVSSFTPPTTAYGRDHTTLLLLHMDVNFNDDPTYVNLSAIRLSGIVVPTDQIGLPLQADIATIILTLLGITLTLIGMPRKVRW